MECPIMGFITFHVFKIPMIFYIPLYSIVVISFKLSGSVEDRVGSLVPKFQ